MRCLSPLPSLLPREPRCSAAADRYERARRVSANPSAERRQAGEQRRPAGVEAVADLLQLRAQARRQRRGIGRRAALPRLQARRSSICGTCSVTAPPASRCPGCAVRWFAHAIRHLTADAAGRGIEIHPRRQRLAGAQPYPHAYRRPSAAAARTKAAAGLQAFRRQRRPLEARPRTVIRPQARYEQRRRAFGVLRAGWGSNRSARYCEPARSRRRAPAGGPSASLP